MVREIKLVNYILKGKLKGNIKGKKEILKGKKKSTIKAFFIEKSIMLELKFTKIELKLKSL